MWIDLAGVSEENRVYFLLVKIDEYMFKSMLNGIETVKFGYNGVLFSAKSSSHWDGSLSSLPLIQLTWKISSPNGKYYIAEGSGEFKIWNVAAFSESDQSEEGEETEESETETEE